MTEALRSPRPHYVSYESFVRGGGNVSKPKKYNFPDMVVRENYASFLGNIFGRAGRHIPVVWAQCVWQQRYTGHHYPETFEAFLDAGGMQTFSPEEWQRIRAIYNGVSEHKPRTDAQLAAIVDLNLRRIIQGGDLRPSIERFSTHIPLDVIYGYKTKEELFEGMDGFMALFDTYRTP